MRSKFKWIFTLLVAFSMQFSYAQEKTVTGTVTESGLPLPGVTIMVKGTDKVTQTDFDGKYSVRAKAGDVLEFTFVGMQTKTVSVAASNVYNIVMEEDVEQLGEVVIVGYGTTTKEGFTGSAAKVNIENIEAKTVSNISQALRGEVAGVSVSTTNGRPGSSAVIRVRGLGSVNGNRAPLYVVDGAPYSSNISAINPEDIEDITVLKDAAATSIYGSRGANGVILITTKQGKVGTSVITVDFKTSINRLMLPTYDVIKSPEEYIGIAWDQLKLNASLSGHPNPAGYASANLYQDVPTVGIHSNYNIWNVSGNQLIDPATGQVAQGVSRRYTPNTFKDAAIGTGYRSEATIQMRGGNDKTRYATSFGYLNDEGYAVNSGFTRYTSRINLEHKPKDWLTVGANMSYTGGRYVRNDGAENGTGSSGNAFAYISGAPAIYDVYLRDSDGNLVSDPYFGGYQYDYGQATGRRYMNNTNGVGDSHYDIARDDTTTLLGNFNVNIDFTDWLTLETRYSGQYQMESSTDVQNPYYGSGYSSEGYLDKDNQKITNQNFLQLLRFNKTFAEDHAIEAFIAHESTEWRYNRLRGVATGAVVPLGEDLYQYTEYAGMSSYQLGWTLESYFAQLNYNYGRKYYLTASGRRDGSSRFINDKWGTFGSVGLGWIVSREDFLSDVNFLDYLKLKASYGVIGDQGTAYQYGWQMYNLNPLTGSLQYTPSSTLANPDLTWETSKIAQVGIESTWFDMLDVNVDYYVKNTTNLFFNQAMPPSSGYTVIQVNDGKLRNSGLEFDVQARVIKAKSPEDFSLSLGVNGESLTNKLEEMPIDRFTGVKKHIQTHSGVFAYSEGSSIYDFYTREWAGVDPATGVGLWNMYFDDIDGNGVFNNGDVPISTMEDYLFNNPDANVEKTVTDNSAQATQKYIGKSALPKVRGAFRVNAGYKNFDFTAQFGYSLGGYGYDYGYAVLMDTGNSIGNDNYHVDIRDRWQQPGDITNVPRLSAGYGNDTNFGRNTSSTRHIVKSDYLSLNNIRLGYTIPKQFVEKLHISRLNLYVAGDNLMMWSSRNGFNPQALGDDAYSGQGYMPVTTFTFGAKVEF